MGGLPFFLPWYQVVLNLPFFKEIPRAPEFDHVTFLHGAAGKRSTGRRGHRDAFKRSAFLCLGPKMTRVGARAAAKNAVYLPKKVVLTPQWV